MSRISPRLYMSCQPVKTYTGTEMFFIFASTERSWYTGPSCGMSRVSIANCCWARSSAWGWGPMPIDCAAVWPANHCPTKPWSYSPLCQITSRYGSVGGWPTTTASRCGGGGGAPSNEVMAEYEYPYSATCPLLHG